MATTSQATAVPFPIPTLLIMKEITSSSMLYETLVLVSLFCIFQILNAFLFWFSRRSRRRILQEVARYYPTCVYLEEQNIICEQDQWLEYIMDERCQLSEAAEANERFFRRAHKRHPRAVRQHDLWSHGWHIMALLIRYLTSQLLAADFCLRKKAGSWMSIDRVFGVVIAEKVIISSLSSSAPRFWYKGSVERNNYSGSRLGNSITRRPQKLEQVKVVDKLLAKLWAHIGNGGTELKAYKKSRTTYPGKHGHNVGSAFRNRAQGGDGSSEERTIQGSPDTTVNSSVQMTSPLPKTIPQTAPPATPPPLQKPPSPTLRATSQVQPPTPAPQVQPPTQTPQVRPPTRTPTPSPPPTPPPPPPPRGWFNFNFAGWFAFNFAEWFNFNVAGLAKIFLAINATLVLAAPQIVQSGGNSLSANDKMLLFGTKLFGLAGFIFCLLAYIVRQDNIAAKLLIVFGVVADIFGLLLIVALGR